MLDMRDRQSCKSNDRIHRSSDIMRHIGQEYALRLARSVRLHEGILKQTLLLHLLAHLHIHTAETHDNSLDLLPCSGPDDLHLEISHLIIPQSPVIHDTEFLVRQFVLKAVYRSR